MPLEAEPSAWDFLTLIAWWNLYGLPALLTVVALILAIRQYIVLMPVKIAWPKPSAPITPETPRGKTIDDGQESR